MQAGHEMLKVGWDFERVFAGEHARRKVGLLSKGLRRAFPGTVEFAQMGIGGSYTRTCIEAHGLRSLEGRDSLVMLPCDEMSQTQHEPVAKGD